MSNHVSQDMINIAMENMYVVVVLKCPQKPLYFKEVIIGRMFSISVYVPVSRCITNFPFKNR